jgi:hypothetical protein
LLLFWFWFFGGCWWRVRGEQGRPAGGTRRRRRCRRRRVASVVRSVLYAFQLKRTAERRDGHQDQGQPPRGARSPHGCSWRPWRPPLLFVAGVRDLLSPFTERSGGAPETTPLFHPKRPKARGRALDGLLDDLKYGNHHCLPSNAREQGKGRRLLGALDCGKREAAGRERPFSSPSCCSLWGRRRDGRARREFGACVCVCVCSVHKTKSERDREAALSSHSASASAACGRQTCADGGGGKRRLPPASKHTHTQKTITQPPSTT